MTDEQPTGAPEEGILGPSYRTSTVGAFLLIAIAAFEALAVTTVMPTIARQLHGDDLYSLSFAAPLASGVVGMVAAGAWSDRRGPRRALEVSLLLFALGLLVCGLAAAMVPFVLARLVQGLGSGGLIAALYVVVGEVYPSRLQPALFASFAAAWVLPALVGPGVAALVAHALGWRWVFLAVLGLVALAAVFVQPALRMLRSHAHEDTDAKADGRSGGTRLVLWALLAALAALAVELLGSLEGALGLLALAPVVVLALALRPLLPRGTLRSGRGLPSVIALRGLLAGSFFCAEAYIVYVLEDQWGVSTGRAGIALTVVGIVWALASQAQARLRDRLDDSQVMVVGTSILAVGVGALLVGVVADLHPLVAALGYGIGGAGMGFGYPRTGVATLAASTDEDRGFNSAALSVSDSISGAVALSVAGALFAIEQRAGGNPFVIVFAFSVVIAAVAVVVARRTRSSMP